MSVNNSVTLIGRPTKDIDVRVNGETTVTRFSLAVDRKKSKDKSADFVSCVAFNKTAEFLNKYVKKGSKIVVLGEIRTGSYEKDGKKFYTTDVVVNEVEFASSKEQGEGQESVPEEYINVPEGIESDLPFK